MVAENEEKPRATRTRRKKNANTNLSDEARAITTIYCRKCMRQRATKFFYEATDKILDSNGYISICNDCIEDLYNKFYSSEGSMEKSILKLCRLLNIKYDVSVIDTTKGEIETFINSGRNINAFFGKYKKNLLKADGGNLGTGSGELDLAFHEPLKYTASGLDPEEYEESDIASLEKFWGKGMEPDEYQFLEEKLAEWKKSYSCKTKSEEVYIKEACFRELDLRKARMGTGDVNSILKSMNELLRAAALTPSQASAADSGKSHDTWGVIIKTVEETTPAEYFKDKTLFKDFDGIERKYIIPFIVRSLKNFVLGSKDFDISEDNHDFDILLGDEEV